MAKAETGTLRAPRGTKPVSAAFFSALDAAPEAQRVAIARAAQVMIRDELRARREKTKAASDRARANGKLATTAAPGRKAAAPAGKPARKGGAASGKAAAANSASAASTKAAAKAPAKKIEAKKTAAKRATPKAAASKVAMQPAAPVDETAELASDVLPAKARRAPKPAADPE